VEVFLYGHSLYFNENYILGARFFYYVHEEAIRCSSEMLDKYNNLNSMNGLVDYCQNFKYSIYSDAVNTIITKVNRATSSNLLVKETFLKTCNNSWGKFELVVGEIFEKYLELSNKMELIKTYQQLKKDTIHNIYGNPLNTQNAVNEIINANVAMLTLEGVHSIVNLNEPPHTNSIITKVNRATISNLLVKETFLKTCNNFWGKFELVVGEIFEKYLELSNKMELIKTYQQLKKDTLHNIYGDPLYTQNAVNEIINANVAMLTLESVHSIVNLNEPPHTNSIITNEMKKILNNERIILSLSNAIYEDILSIIEPLTTFLEANSTFRMCYSYEEYLKAKRISEDIENDIIPKEKLKQYTSQMIYLSPFEPKNYAIAYYLFGDDTNELEDISKKFEVDIDFNNYKAAEKNAKTFFGDDFDKIEILMNNNMFYKQTKDLLGKTLTDLLYECKFLFNSNLQKIVISKLEKGEFLRFNNTINLFGCFHTSTETPLMVFDNGASTSGKDGFIITDKCLYFYIGTIVDLIAIKRIDLNSDYFTINDVKISVALKNLTEGDLIEIKDFFDYFLIVYKYYIKQPMLNKSIVVNSNTLIAFKSKNDILEYAKGIMKIFYDEGLKKHLSALNTDIDANEDVISHTRKKFNNAMDSYACLEEDEIPLLCFDNTAMGSAKDGCLITSRGLHIHNSYQKPKVFHYEDIQAIEIKRTNPLTLLINDYELQTTLINSNDSKVKFCSILNRIKKDFTSKSILTALQSKSNEIINNDTDLVEHISRMLVETSINTDIAKNVFLYSKVPRILRKFENAINTYAILDEGEIPLICYDNTVFGSAKEGCLITTKCIHVHNSFSKPSKFYYKEIINISLNGPNTKDLFINNYELQTTNLITHDSKIIFCKLLKFIFENARKE
jgi:hypothetical protein